MDLRPIRRIEEGNSKAEKTPFFVILSGVVQR